MLFVEDGGEGIYVRAAKDAGLISGDRVLVWGTMADSFRPWISADRVRLLRHGRPPDPVRTPAKYTRREMERVEFGQ
jgi:hypothetical protein